MAVMSDHPMPLNGPGSIQPAPALTIHHLVKRYRVPFGGSATVLDLPYLSLAAGQQVALRGESGLGKTTLLHMIGGILVPDSGLIEVGGRPMTGLSEPQRDRFRARHLGYIFQTFNLLQGLTVLENVELGLAFGKGVDRRAAIEALERVGLGNRIHYLPRHLSTGQQQRVAVARALVNRPCLILADEPTGNLDSLQSRRVVALLRESASALGAALLLATHDAEVLASFEEILDLAALNRVQRHGEEV